MNTVIASPAFFAGRGNRLMTKTNAGMTIIEILMTLSLVTLVCFFALPSFHHQTDRVTDTLIQAQLIQQLQHAQMLANANMANIGVCLSEDGKSCVTAGRMVLTFLENSHQYIANEQLKGKGKLQLRSYPFYRDYIVVKPAAITSSDNGTFSYYDQHHQFRWSVAIGQYSEPHIV